MEQNNYLDIIEGMLYLAGDDGVDIKQVAGVLEISKKEATLLMDQFTEIYGNKALKGIVLVNFGGRYKLATNADYFIYYQKMVDICTSLSESPANWSKWSLMKRAW